MGFLRLYLYCADQARKGEYDEVAHLLRELRDTWTQVKEQYQPQAQPQPAAPPASEAAGQGIRLAVSA